MSKAERYDVPKLPENSVLDLEDYLAMQRAIGEQSRYRILAELLRDGEMSAMELIDALDIKSNSLHYSSGRTRRRRIGRKPKTQGTRC